MHVKEFTEYCEELEEYKKNCKLIFAKYPNADVWDFEYHRHGQFVFQDDSFEYKNVFIEESESLQDKDADTFHLYLMGGEMFGDVPLTHRGPTIGFFGTKFNGFLLTKEFLEFVLPKQSNNEFMGMLKLELFSKLNKFELERIQDGSYSSHYERTKTFVSDLDEEFQKVRLFI